MLLLRASPGSAANTSESAHKPAGPGRPLSAGWPQSALLVNGDGCRGLLGNSASRICRSELERATARRARSFTPGWRILEGLKTCLRTPIFYVVCQGNTRMYDPHYHSVLVPADMVAQQTVDRLQKEYQQLDETSAKQKPASGAHLDALKLAAGKSLHRLTADLLDFYQRGFMQVPGGLGSDTRVLVKAELYDHVAQQFDRIDELFRDAARRNGATAEVAAGFKEDLADAKRQLSVLITRIAS